MGLEGDEVGVWEFGDCVLDVVSEIGVIGHFAVAAKR